GCFQAAGALSWIFQPRGRSRERPLGFCCAATITRGLRPRRTDCQSVGQRLASLAEIAMRLSCSIACGFGIVLICVSAVRLPAQDAASTIPATKAPATSVIDVEALAARTRKSIVVVSYSDRDGKRTGLGTGFVISADGLIATNLHVI